MTIIALKCPNCSGDVQLDDGREFGFCIYCGTRIIISDFITRKIEIDYSGKASSYADIALDWLNRGEMERAREYADKALDLDPSNPDAWYVRGMLSEERVDKTMGPLSGRSDPGVQILWNHPNSSWMNCTEDSMW